MSEILLIACICGTVYHLMLWCQTGSYRQLAAPVRPCCWAHFTRYGGLVVDVAVVAGDRLGCLAAPSQDGLPSRLSRAQADLIFYRHPGLHRHPGLDLLEPGHLPRRALLPDRRVRQALLWVSRHELAIGHPRVAALTYLDAMAGNVGWLAWPSPSWAWLLPGPQPSPGRRGRALTCC